MADQGCSNAGHIEVQLAEVAAAPSDHLNPTTNTTNPTDQNPDSSKDNNAAHLRTGFLAKLISPLRTLINSISCSLWRFLKIPSLCLRYILCAVFIIGWIFISGDTSLTHYFVMNDPDEDDNNKRSSHVKMKKRTVKNKVQHLSILTAVRVGCLILAWMVINQRVASLRGVTVLESQLWKWSLLAAVILLGYLPLVMIDQAVYYVMTEGGFKGSNVWYCIQNIAQSVMLALYFMSVLLTWLLCVDTTNASLHRYGDLTLISFLVGAVLNVIKSLVLLFWKSNLIYNKYQSKILSAGCQLYFHLLVTDQSKNDSFLLVYWCDWKKYATQKFVGDGETKEVEDYNGWMNQRKILPIEEYILKQGATLRHVHEVATYLTLNFELSLTENDEIPDIAAYLQKKFRDVRSMPAFSITGSVYEKSQMDKDDANLLLELLQAETSKETPTYEDFENWMVDGLKNCYAVGHTINGAFEVMRILNRILTSFIVVFVILIWLFITGFATTKVVVGLASVFLGLVFVFGDTCKTFFQGVIFSFVTHPFDVADRCIIDNKELKVKKINVLTTTFFGSQSKEVVLYPNSDLATKHITLLHGEPAADLADLIEFNLPSDTSSLQIESLQENIQGYLEHGFQSGQYKKSYRVTLMEIGDNIRMRVHFEHNLSNGDKCEDLESIEIRKEKQRSMFLLQLRKCLENIAHEVSPS